MTLTTKGLLAVIAALALATGVLFWRMRAAQHDTVEAAVAPAKAVAAEAKAKVETLTVRLAGAERVVTKVIHDVRTDTLVLRPQTHEDTVRALAQLPTLAAAHDSLQRSCSTFVVTCGEYRASAENRFAADANVISTQQALLRDRPPKRHWTPCLSGGYGATLHGGLVLTGPTVNVGLCWSPF